MDKANTPQRNGSLQTTSGRGELVKVYERPVADGPEEIRYEIEASRRQIAESLQLLQDEVETRVERATDWRGFARERPLATVGFAFGIGLYLGLR